MSSEPEPPISELLGSDVARKIDATGSVRHAPAPFDQPTADVVLRSDDDVDFRVHRLILTFASPFFEGLFSLPQPPPSSSPSCPPPLATTLSTYHLYQNGDHPASGTDPDTDVSGVPLIRLTEPFAILDFLLRTIYPVRSPPPPPLDTLPAILTAARKYQLDAIDEAAEAALALAVPGDPLGAYALACACGLQSIAERAARATLKLARMGHSKHFAAMSGEQHYRLLEYRERCVRAVEEVVRMDPVAVGNSSGGGEGALEWLAPCPDTLVRASAAPCASCFVSPPSAHDALAAKNPSKLNAFTAVMIGSGMAADGAGAGAPNGPAVGAGATGWRAPPFFWMYFARVSARLRERPHRDVVFEDAAGDVPEAPLRCAHLSRYDYDIVTGFDARSGLEMFKRLLAAEVDRALDQVGANGYFASGANDLVRSLLREHDYT